MRFVVMVAVLAVGGGCGHRMKTTSNTKRLAVVVPSQPVDSEPPDEVKTLETRWRNCHFAGVPSLEAGGDGTCPDDLPKVSPVQVWESLERAKSLSRTSCLEFAGPGTTLNDMKGVLTVEGDLIDASGGAGGKADKADGDGAGEQSEASAGAGSTSISLDLSNTQSFAQVYTVSEILLYGHTTFFRLCEARRNGDLNALQYADAFQQTRTHVKDLVQYTLETERAAIATKVEEAKEKVDAADEALDDTVKALPPASKEQVAAIVEEAKQLIRAKPLARADEPYLVKLAAPELELSPELRADLERQLQELQKAAAREAMLEKRLDP